MGGGEGTASPRAQGKADMEAQRPLGLVWQSAALGPAPNMVLAEVLWASASQSVTWGCQAILEAFSGSKGCVQLLPAPACSWCSASLPSFSSQELGERPQHIWLSQGRALAGMERVLLLLWHLVRVP